MNNTSTPSRWALRAAATTLLAACGGGGTSGDAPKAGTATPVVFTSTNQTIASQEGVSSAYLPINGASTIAGAQVADESLIFDAMRKQVDSIPAYIRALATNTTITGVTQSEVLNCTGGGTLTITGNIANPTAGVSAGDTLQLVAAACKEAGYAINGGFSARINSVTGSFGVAPYSAGLTLTFSGFGVSAPQFSGSMNGDLSLSIAANSLRSSTATLTSSALTISATYAGTSRSRSLTNYNVTSTKAPSGLFATDTTNTIAGTVSSSALDSQSLTFSTLTPMVTRGSDVYPSSGVIALTGGKNTRIRITALNNAQYKQELDADGDGVYETNSTNPWSTLF
jgi:hypothetical protein